MRVVRWLVMLAILCGRLHAAAPGCAAGTPVGEMLLHVVRPGVAKPLPIREAARVLPGDKIVYDPGPSGSEAHKGQVAMILVPSRPDGKDDLELLPPKPASARAEWPVNLRAKTAVYVYGPGGLNARKVKRYLAKDSALIEQLADYAQNTAQTEFLLQALANAGSPGATENLNAALSGFASQYGLNNRINRDAPLDQQTLAMFRSLNPALASYDPISPQNSQRVVSQTAGLATVVAGMFLGNPVGLAAGGTALGINFKSILFPDTEFRSSFAQPAANAISLCGKREPSRGRTKLAYLWAMRVPDADVPAITAAAPANILAGVKNPVSFQIPGGESKLLERVRGWKFAASGRSFDVPARVTGPRAVEFDLAAIPPGEYSLSGTWDEAPFQVNGSVTVHQPPDLSKARLTLDTHDLLVERVGKRVVTLEGADVQFVETLAILRVGDRFGSPAPVAFRLTGGPRQGIQQKMEAEIDTATLTSGEHELRFEQGDGRAQSAAIQVLPPPPRITNLPLRVHLDEPAQPVRIEGEGIDRIATVSAPGVGFRLAPGDGRQRRADATIQDKPRAGQLLDLFVRAEGYSNPVRIAGGLRVAQARPVIRSARILPPSGLGIALGEGELPAGIQTGAVLDVKNASPRMSVEIGCAGARRLRAAIGEQRDGLKVQSLAPDRLYLAFDPAAWPSGCAIEATADAGDQGVSAPAAIGRTVRTPRVDKFELTDQPAGDGAYFGVLTGRDLELIERAGWTAANGLAVSELPATAGGASQTLRIKLPWPSPTPRAPLFLWLRGDTEGRSTSIR